MAPKNMRREYIIDWCTPGHARDLVVVALKITGNAAQEAIWKHILDSQIEVVASRTSKLSLAGAVISRHGPSSIDAQRWALLDKDASHFWAGEAVLAVPATTHAPSLRYHLHAIRVEPDQVARLFPAIAPASSTTSVQPTNLSRHQTAWWNEPLIVELAARLHNRELQLTTLPDLEKSARSWLASQNEYPSKKVIRQAVTPLWQRISSRRPTT